MKRYNLERKTFIRSTVLAMVCWNSLAAGFQGEPTPRPPTIRLSVLGRYRTGLFNQSAAEIVAHHAPTQRLFVVNAQAGTVEVLDISNPAEPRKVLAGAFNLAADIPTVLPGFVTGAANSVAVHGDRVAIAVEASVKQSNGAVAFYDARSGSFLHALEVGPLPDMLTFSPDGRYVLVANEGEPNSDYSVDPEGSVSVIDVSAGVGAGQAVVRTATFTAFNGHAATLSAAGAHFTFFGSAPSVAKDLEPEYIAVSPNSKTAWVTCQEANLLAVVELDSARVKELLPLGFKDHARLGNGLDPSDRDGQVAISSWSVLGMYQPDAIAAYTAGGETYLVTANEGDARDYASPHKEEARVASLALDPTVFPASLQAPERLGRLTVTTRRGGTEVVDPSTGTPRTVYSRLYAFGARSFSIWTPSGRRVFDSGDELEQVIAAEYPASFNSDNNSNTSFDSRSDNKGPEPEGLALGTLGEHTYAFIGLERMGGIMVYDITSPGHPRFLQYINPRDFSVVDVAASVAGDGKVGDLGPEGLTFIPASASPNGKPLLAVANELSGTTTLYQVDVL